MIDFLFHHGINYRQQQLAQPPPGSGVHGVEQFRRGELRRQFTRLTEQVTQLEDSLQETRDLLQQVNELSEKQLQTLLSDVHEWVSAFERTVGRTRQT